MADIKTRDKVKGTIKSIDKAYVAGQRMKRAYISTKDKAEHSTCFDENSADEYAEDRFEQGIDTTVREGVRLAGRAGRKGIDVTKESIRKANDAVRNFKVKHNKNSLQKQMQNIGNKMVRTSEKTAEQTIKQSARSSGNKTIKTVGKGSANAVQKSVKTAEQTEKTAIKTSQQAAKTAQQTAKAAAKAAQKAAQIAKAAAKAAAESVKVTVKATVTATKAVIAGIKALAAAIAAGGWIAVLIILVVCLLALILSSVFGIFFSGEDKSSGMSIQTVIQEIGTEYEDRLSEIKDSNTYDVVEISGNKTEWKEVLTVYSVKVNTDADNPQEVVTMDEGKRQLLKDIFWEMNSISSRTESKEETVVTESNDGNGNVVRTETTVTKTYLYITVTHKTADEMAEEYGFSEEQREMIEVLLREENVDLWEGWEE